MGLLGWRLVDNWGNYGVYGWGLGIWRSRGPVTHPKWDVEDDIVIQIGPFKAMARKVTKNGVAV